MNGSIIRYILGYILKIESALLLLPCLTAVIYQEQEGFAYLGVAAICLLIGVLATLRKPSSFVFYQKEGCVATALSWIVMSIFGCLPFIFTGEIPSFTDALFETVSGFTTTGATILSDVEAVSRCSTLWRCFTHWIGGMGVLVFLLAIIPMSGGSHINLMRAESTGASVGKLVPKVKYTARILYLIYIGLSALQFVLLLFGKMPVYDAICTTFGTAGTGGFGIKNDSIGSYSPYIQWVVTIFMLLFGVSFNTYYYILYRNLKKAFSSDEVKYYFIIVAVAIAIIFFQIFHTTSGIEETLRQSSFQVASIISTTGFSTVDFAKWSQTAQVVLLSLMFIGSCAGSTAGGIKVSRIILLVRTVKKELNSFIHPKSIKKIKVDKKPVEHEVVRSVNVFFITFFLIFATSLFIISFNDLDFLSNFTAVAACINNIGPGLGAVGPTENFGFLPPLTKYVLIFDMLAGRLELFPLLLLFHPAIWKESFAKHKDRKK
mgnify:FL=1